MVLTPQDVAELIKRIAKDKGVSVAWIAADMGVRNNHLSMMMTGYQKSYSKEVLEYLGLVKITLYVGEDGSSRGSDNG